MASSLILCGGTGAHAGVAFLRLHTLGYALGFFRPQRAQDERPFELPKLYLVDQDAGDGDDREPTAWQLAGQLRERHPGRFDWRRTIGREEGPVMVNVTPLPVGADKGWFRPPNNVLSRRFEASPWLPVLASRRQQQIDYSKGMMGSPAIGSLLFKLKAYDEHNKGLNRDEVFGELLAEQGRLVVAGSGVGGTGAAVGPTLAQQLARPASQVMAVMVLNWFLFEENEAEEDRRAKAQLRNRVMRENANSALEFYGQDLSRTVAAVPVGMPERAYLKRRYTADVGQPVRESFIHAVAALCAMRHFLRDSPYGPGLYAMGAVDRGRLDGATAIPGGTLQGLANQAATLAELLETWQRVLQRPQPGKLRPAIHDAVAAVAEPALVAEHLGSELAHYREQLAWLKEVLGIEGTPARGFTSEVQVRERLVSEGSRLPLAGERSPEQVPAVLLEWTAEWIREVAARAGMTVGLATQAGAATGAQWPDYTTEGIGLSPRDSGELTRVSDQNIAAVLDAFVDRGRLATNGWPHPVAAAHYFRHAIDRRDPVAMRQLELLLLGMMTKRFEVRPTEAPETLEREISLEYLAAEYRREGFDGLANHGLFDRERGGELVGFTSPHTLLCPVPFMDDDADNRFWQGLWAELAGASDGAPWQQATAPPKWEDRVPAIRQVRAWIEEEKRRRRGVPPAWTRAFEGVAVPGPAPLYGYGARVRVYWAGTAAAAAQLVELELPTPELGGDHGLPAGTDELAESEMLAAVRELERVLDGAGNELFSSFAFDKPDGTGTVRGFWEEHLNLLRQREKIRSWSRTERGELRVTLLAGEELKQAVFAGSEVLSRARIEIGRCIPFVQGPVPGSLTPAGDLRCPDLPLRSDYLDLVLTPEGRSLRELVEQGLPLGPLLRRPELRRDTQQRLVIRWQLRLRGRPDPMSFEIRLEGKDGQPYSPSQTAHLMVWPRFRDRAGRWRAYYLYFYSSVLGAACDVLFLGAGTQGSGFRLRRSRGDGRSPALAPVAFQGGAKPAHTGGAPVALALRQPDADQELGLYLVPLEPIPDAEVGVEAAVDFGTSHTVAAFRVAGEPAARTVELAADLDPGAARNALTLHVCEDAAHVEAAEIDGGLLAAAAWLPTYRATRGEASLPSELLLSSPQQQMKSRPIADWVPLRDFTIPPLEVSRADLAEFLLSDFKWDAGSEFFRGREKELREHYLALYLELALAEIAGNHLHALPAQPVHFTFTYPLRANDPHRKALLASMKSALARGTASLGVPLDLLNNVGLFDESRAARLETKNFGQVCVVGDLGGGTLDLFIAAFNGDRPLREVADSVKLGGNLLLHRIAMDPAGFLPPDGHWYEARGDARNGGARQTETFLRAWMRSMGSSRLFGAEAGERPELKTLALSGFASAAQAQRARQLIDRYFRLVGEYMARNLVAFLVREWYPNVPPEDHARLRISVQLRGNGWRLRYQRGSHVQATQAIQDLVRGRLAALWPLAPDNPHPAPPADQQWEPANRFAVTDPKTEPIRSVVGRTMDPEQVKDLWYTHTLTDLEVRRDNGKFLPIPWTAPVPFFTAGSRQLQIEAVSPPLELSSPDADARVEIRALEALQQRNINEALQDREGAIEEEVKFRAPVAPLVWEAVFGSSNFWPGGEGR
jgi:hypothetical protein